MCPDEPESAPRSVTISPRADAPESAHAVERDIPGMFLFTRVIADVVSSITAPAQKTRNKTAMLLRGALFRASDALKTISELLAEGNIEDALMVAKDAQANADESAREIL